MKFKPSDPGYRQKIKASFERQRFMHAIDARLVSITPGRCEIELPFRSDLTQQHGYFHAGIVGTLADNAAGFAAFSLMPAGTSVLTVEFKLNLLAPAVGDALVSRGHVVKAGRTLTICRADIFARIKASEKLCATALLTMMAVDNDKETAYADKSNFI